MLGNSNVAVANQQAIVACVNNNTITLDEAPTIPRTNACGALH
jgi:hypothetical protein